MSHFRNKRGVEVDVVLSHRRRGVVGVEVKAKNSLRKADFRGLDALAEVASARWLRGIVLYQGGELLPVGEHWAVPISALWRW